MFPIRHDLSYGALVATGFLLISYVPVSILQVLHIAYICRSDSKARDKSLAKIAREENLSNLRLELSNRRVVTIGELRGTARLVILAGPGSYIEEAFKQSEPYKQELLDRGVLVAAYATDGASFADYSSVSSSMFFLFFKSILPEYYDHVGL